MKKDATSEAIPVATILPPVILAEGAERYFEYDAVTNTAIISSAGTELRKGRIVIDTGISLAPRTNAIVLPCDDNARFGLLIENGGRCTHSDIIPQFVRGGQQVNVIIKVDDDVMVTEQGAFGSRVRFANIPAGTPIAQMIFLND